MNEKDMLEINDLIGENLEENKNNEDNKDEIQIIGENLDIKNLNLLNPLHFNNILKNNCRMNNLFLSKKEFYYICPNCPNHMRILCEYCIEECHKVHRKNKKIESLKGELINFYDEPCQCALHDHQIIKGGELLNREDTKNAENKKAYCDYNNIFLLGSKTIYRRKSDKKIYCLFCIYNFIMKSEKKDEEKKNKFMDILKSNINKDDKNIEEQIAYEDVSNDQKFHELYEEIEYREGMNYNCQCDMNEHKHEIKSENLTNLINFFQSESMYNKINLDKIAFTYLTNSELINKICPEFLYVHERIIDILMEENIKKNEFGNINLEDKIDWDSYFKCTSLILIFMDRIKNLKNLKIEVFDEKFKTFFSYKNIEKLLSYKSNTEKNFVELQNFSVKMYRKFINLVTYKHSDFNDENENCFQRIILKNNLNHQRLFNEGKTIAEKIFYLLYNLYEDENINQKIFCDFYSEGLKIIKKLIIFYSNDYNENISLFNLIKENISIIKEKKDGQNKVLKCLEKICERILLNINDIKFYDCIVGNNSKTDFCFIENQINNEIIELLYSFNINNEKYINSQTLYDNLINEKDFYIVGIQNFLNSKQNNIISEKYEDILFLAKKTDNLNYSEELLNNFMNISNEILDYLKNKIDDKTLINNIFKKFEILINNIENYDLIEQFKFVKNKRIIDLMEIFKFCEKLFLYFKSINLQFNEENKFYFYFDKILYLICKNNPFVASLFFHKNMIELLINKNDLNLKFYYEILLIMKEFNYKINSYHLTQHIYNNNNDFRNIILILKIFKIILQISDEKSIMLSNNLIATKLKDLLNNEDFKTNFTAINNKNILINSDSFRFNFNNFNENKEIKINLKNDPILIESVFECIINLQKEYFYMITPFINIKEIKKKLKHGSLISLEMRKILTQIYNNYYLISYFNIKENKKFFESDNIFSQNLIKNKEDKVLEIVYINLESFKYYFLNNQNIFLNNFEFLMEYFQDVILLPIIYMIYKITYFCDDYNANVKYKVYKLTFLFLQCLQYLFEDVLNNFDITDNDNKKIFLEHFDDINNIDIIKQNCLNSVEKLSHASIELLNIEKMINVHLIKNLEHFVIYKQKFNNLEDNVSKNQEDEPKEEENEENDEKNIMKRINDLVDNYLEEKSDYENNNVFNHIFGLEHLENIQKIISLDLLNRFYYPRPKLPQNQITTRKSLIFKGNIDNTLGQYINPYISTFLENKTFTIESIIKLFKTNPGFWQSIIVDESQNTKDLFNILITKQLPFLIQFVFIEFNRIDCNNENFYYQNFVNILEFLRLLCEDHNPLFQTMLINYEKCLGKISIKNYDEYEFLPFISRIPVMVLNNIEHSIKKKELLKCFRNFDAEFFTPLLEKVTDFLIEIIQGTYSENFYDIVNSKELVSKSSLKEYFKKHYDYFDDLETNLEYQSILSNFIKFLNCFIEENSNPLKIKAPIIILLNPNKMIICALAAFKKLVKKYINLNSDMTLSTYNELLQLFIEKNDEMNNDPLFNLSTGIFIHLNRVNSYNNKSIGDKFNSILSNFQDIIEYEEEDILNDKNKLLRYNYYMFCTKLIKKNEISFTEDKSKDEKEIYQYRNFFTKNYKINVIDERNNSTSKKSKFENVFFLVHPDSLFLEENDTKTFLEKASYDNFNVKLNYVLDYYPEIANLIEMRKMFNNAKILLFLYQLSYSKLEKVNAIFSVITNINLIFAEENNFFNLIKDPFAFIHIILLSLLIFNWYIFNLIKKLKTSEEKVPFLDVIKFFFVSIFNLEIFPFIWTFFFGIIALLSPQLNFLFSLQLFPIFNIFDTMRDVLFAVKVRYKQFISTAFLLVILILFYAALTFYYFRQMDDGTELCSSYLECFVYLFNYGIRAGGVPFNIKIESQVGFYSEFLYSWVFYFIIILIVLNIINGIIVDTFQALRENANETEEEKSNVCFICSLHRSDFEIKGIDFEYHTNMEHKIENYFNYLLKVQRTDEHDLNSIDFQVFNSIKQHKIEFFPIKKAKSLEE